MGLSYNGENPDKGHAIFHGVRMRSCTPTGYPDPISVSCLDYQDGKHEKHRLRLQELEALDNKRLQAQQQIELYQAWVFRAFNKKVKE